MVFVLTYVIQPKPVQDNVWVIMIFHVFNIHYGLYYGTCCTEWSLKLKLPTFNTCSGQPVVILYDIMTSRQNLLYLCLDNR